MQPSFPQKKRKKLWVLFLYLFCAENCFIFSLNHCPNKNISKYYFRFENILEKKRYKSIFNFWHHFRWLQSSNEYVTLFPLWKPCTFFSPTQKPFKTYRFEQHTFVSRRLAAVFSTWRRWRQQFWLIFMKIPSPLSLPGGNTWGTSSPHRGRALFSFWILASARGLAWGALTHSVSIQRGTSMFVFYSN